MSNINIGLNTVHHDIKSIFNLGMTRVELCLGRVEDRESRMAQVKDELIKLSSLKTPYTIHHPIFMPEFFKHDYLESFFLDKEENNREISFLLLEENLKFLRCIIDESSERKLPDYLVVHFPGVYPTPYMEEEDFARLLKSSLDRVSDMAQKYGVTLALEYFGSNIMFCEPEMWIKEIGKRKGITILTDTGHLYFASIMREFDFMEAYDKLLANSSGVHLWTTAGSKYFVEDESIMEEFSKIRPHYKIVGSKDVYGANEFYRRYHHVALSPNQLIEEGWAFDGMTVLEKAVDSGMPIILEATPYYGGTQYYIETIKKVAAFANDCLSKKKSG